MSHFTLVQRKQAESFNNTEECFSYIFLFLQFLSLNEKAFI